MTGCLRRAAVLPVVIATAACTAALVALPASVQAQDPSEQEPRQNPFDEGDWGFTFTPYAFLASASFDVGGQSVRQSFNDLASLTDAGFQGRVTLRFKRFVLAADGTFADLVAEQDFGLLHVRGDVKQRIYDIKLGYKVLDNRSPEEDSGLAIWASAGGRYWKNTVDVTLNWEPILPGGDPEEDRIETGQDWWDPVLGLVFHIPVTHKVGFLVRATGGGFGIGDASKFMWDAEFSAVFRLSRRLTLSAGYRQFRYTRTDGEGEDQIDTTVSTIGPQLGLAIEVF